MDKSLQLAIENLASHGNSFGLPAKARPRWTERLRFSIKDARKEAVRYLWFVGDFASYEPRAMEATRSAARVFHRAGLDFGILYEGESNSGNDLHLAGQERLFEVLHEKNLRGLSKARFTEIVTTDPHSYQALKYDYPEAVGERPVWHHTQLLGELIATGALTVRHRLRMPVTYHDSCYLGRYNAIFGAPRRLIAALGLTLVEMPRNRTYSYCCGAGGGRIWMENPPAIQEPPALVRVREAAMLEGVHTLAVACPKDLVTFQGAIRAAGLTGRLEVKELSELVEQAVM